MMAGFRPRDGEAIRQLQRLKTRIKLSELIAPDVGLRKDGAEHIGLCPFHVEKSPSFHVVDGKGFYHCFGCGAHGDHADWLTDFKRMSFGDALTFMEQWTGEGVERKVVDHPARAARAEPEPEWAPIHPVPADAPPLFGSVPDFKAGGRTGRIFNPKRAGTDKEWTALKPALVHPYRGPGGELLGYVLRCEHREGGKFTPQVSYCVNLAGERRWCIYPFADPRPLYGLDLLAAAPAEAVVYVLEGEKKTDAARRMVSAADRVFLAWPGGAKGYGHVDWSPLRGRHVVLVPDADKEGCDAVNGYTNPRGRYVPGIADLLVEVGAAVVEAVDPPADLPKGWDLADAEKEGWSGDQVLTWLSAHARRKGEEPNGPDDDGGGAGGEDPRGPGPGPGPGGPADDDFETRTMDDGAEIYVMPEPIWKGRLLLNKEGYPKACLANALVALRDAPEWKGLLQHDEFSRRTFVIGRPPWMREGKVEEPWSDAHDILTAEWLQRAGIMVSADITASAVEAVAREHPFHPVRDWLDGLKWDSVERGETWAIEYCGAEDTPYTRAVSVRFLISAVARIYSPGVKADCMPVLEGEQGFKKSTAIRVLFSPWYTDELSDFGSKDAAMQMLGVWGIEIAELDSMSRSEVGRVKAFLTRTTDRYRPPYGRRVVEAPRSCIFAGTVNLTDYLRDETGGRRFWPIRCTKVIDVDGLEAVKEQLWAEACAKYERGDAHWLETVELVSSAAEQQAERYQGDPWEAAIRNYIEWEERLVEVHPGFSETKPYRRPQPLTDLSVNDILTDALRIDIGKQGQTEQNRVARCLRAMQWERYRKREGRDLQWRYRRKPDVPRASGNTEF